MDRDDENEDKHNCKVCNKTFTNGRSLGGHMRYHLSLDPSFDADEIAGYGLRENPKKSWRVSDSSSLECNKGNVDVDSKSSQSESEITNSTVSRKRRRLKRVAAICDDSLLMPDSNKEQEDGAMTLMMLSRDFDCFDRRTEIDKVEFKNSDVNYGVFDPKSADRFDDYSGIDSDKRSRYKCRTCNRIFSSYQALGGHRASHNVDRNTGMKSVKRLKKSRKDHQCPVCGKTFSSGQALGGHKRSHWAASSGTANSIDIRFQVCNGEEDYNNLWA